jgi:hypothetical protein
MINATQPSTPVAVHSRPTQKGNWFYTQAAKAYQRPVDWKEKADTMTLQAKSETSLLSRTWGRFKANVLRLAAMWMEYDYSRQSSVHLGRLRFKVATPPVGALMLMLYVCTIPPRMYQAYRRGKKENDRREVYDVMRRDIISVTVFIFGLNVLKKVLGKRFQKHYHVNLFDDKTGEMLSYSQFSNYRLNSLQRLKGILNEGNEKGLHRAIDGLHDHRLAELSGDHRLKEALSTLKESMVQLCQMKADAPQRDKQIEALYQALQSAETIRQQVQKDVLKSDRKHGAKLAEKLNEPIPNVLETYAKHSRLPSDMISFGLVAVLLGWFPVWFNKTWNQWQYDRKFS